MKEVLNDVERWRAGGHQVALARVVRVEGSGPRDPGATMVVNDAGEVADRGRRMVAGAGAVDALVVSDPAEAAAIWRIREDGAGLDWRRLRQTWR